jgi:hypothetical protein
LNRRATRRDNLHRLLPLVGGALAFTAVVMGVIAYLTFFSEAGDRRGLVIRSEVDADVRLQFEDGRGAILRPGARQQTFVIRREEFPQALRVFPNDAPANSDPIVERVFEYRELAEADFRIAFDRNGFYDITEVRTPAP